MSVYLLNTEQTTRLAKLTHVPAHKFKVRHLKNKKEFWIVTIVLESNNIDKEVKIKADKLCQIPVQRP